MNADPASHAGTLAAAEAPATLLFVDDEPSILSSLRRLFRPAGYRILIAESGALGLEVLEREQVDLVISDMRMPEMDGARFLEIVRGRWPRVIRILLTGYADISSTVEAINRGEIYRYISKPWNDSDIQLVVREALDHQRLQSENARLVALTHRQNEELRELNAGLEQKVAARTAELSQTAAFLDNAHKELKRNFTASVRVFSGLVEMRGRTLAGHSRRVAELARGIIGRFGPKEADIQNLVFAALLHDIGKLGWPDRLLEKPYNSLDADERAEVERHPAKGEMALMEIDQLKGAAQLIRHHHELYDGSGYPDRLAGLAIPLGSRILAVANDFDALQLGTLVGKSLSRAEAHAYIIANRGKRYDPEVVDGLGAVLARQAGGRDELRALGVAELRPGMTLARDLLHHDGYLLLAKGYVLNSAVIEQLRTLVATESRALSVMINAGPKPGA